MIHSNPIHKLETLISLLLPDARRAIADQIYQQALAVAHNEDNQYRTLMTTVLELVAKAIEEGEDK